MNIWSYVLRRIATIPPSLFIILLIIFLVFSTVGHASPVSSQFPAYSGDSVLSFLSAYGLFCAMIFGKDWGYLGALHGQPTFSGPVSQLVTIYFLSTLEVVLIAAPIALLISFPLGRRLGTNHTRKTAKVARTLVAAGYLTPAYVVALILQLFFGKGVIRGNPIGVLPVTGAYNPSVFLVNGSVPNWLESNGILISSPTHMLLFDSIIHGDFAVTYTILIHMILPVITLVVSITAVVTFLLESGYVDNMGQEYVKSARSRGVPERQIVIKHVRRNAVIPVLASTTIMVAYLLSNIIMMEYVFAYPGIGLFLVTTMTHGQYFPTAVIIFFIGLIIIFIGIAIDIIHFIKNPVIRG